MRYKFVSVILVSVTLFLLGLGTLFFFNSKSIVKKPPHQVYNFTIKYISDLQQIPNYSNPNYISYTVDNVHLNETKHINTNKITVLDTRSFNSIEESMKTVLIDEIKKDYEDSKYIVFCGDYLSLDLNKINGYFGIKETSSEEYIGKTAQENARRIYAYSVIKGTNKPSVGSYINTSNASRNLTNEMISILTGYVNFLEKNNTGQ